MNGLHVFMYVVLIPVTITGGFLRGFAGFGSTLFMLPVLDIFFPPAMSIGVMMCVDLSCNGQLLPDAKQSSSIKIVLPLMLGTLVGMPAGSSALLVVDPVVMKRIICGTILVTTFVLLSGWHCRHSVGSKVLGVVGALSGIVMGATAIAVVPPLFLAATNRNSTQNRANYIIWLFFATIFLIAILAWNRLLALGDMWTIIALIPAYLTGIALGIRTHKRASKQATRGVVLTIIIIVAIVGLLL